jgi:hypothetical protein
MSRPIEPGGTALSDLDFFGPCVAESVQHDRTVELHSHVHLQDHVQRYCESHGDVRDNF